MVIDIDNLDYEKLFKAFVYLNAKEGRSVQISEEDYLRCGSLEGEYKTHVDFDNARYLFKYVVPREPLEE